MSTSPQLSVASLSKRYGSVEAVRNVSFEVARGEIFGLLGPNGAGKTTTLECILGLRRPDAGMISIGELDALAEPEKAKRLVGAQIQGAELQDKITARQALRLFGRFYEHALSPEESLEQFSLADKADVPFAHLSSGQKQRLFLALAFVDQPQLVVLDEPTVGLDPKTRQDLHSLIRARKEKGKTIILSTHSLDEAERHCDRIGILDQGRIVALGTAQELVFRARGQPKLVVRTRQAMSRELVASLPGVSDVQQDEGAPR